MKIKSKKWKRMLAATTGGFLLLLVVNIIPSYYEAASDFISWIEMKNSKENTLTYDIKLKNISNELVLQKAKISSMLSKVDEARNISTYMDELNLFARTTGLSMTSITAKSIEKKEKLLVQPLELALEGSYKQLYEYAFMLEKTTKTYVVRKVLVKSDETGKSNLKIIMNIEVYLNL